MVPRPSSVSPSTPPAPGSDGNSTSRNCAPAWPRRTVRPIPPTPGRRRSDPPCHSGCAGSNARTATPSVSANRRAPSEWSWWPWVSKITAGRWSRLSRVVRTASRCRSSAGPGSTMTAGVPSSPRPRCWCRRASSVTGSAPAPPSAVGNTGPDAHGPVDPMKGRSRELDRFAGVGVHQTPLDLTRRVQERPGQPRAGCGLRPHRTRRGPSGTQPAATTRRSWGSMGIAPTAPRPTPPPE